MYKLKYCASQWRMQRATKIWCKDGGYLLQHNDVIMVSRDNGSVC